MNIEAYVVVGDDDHYCDRNGRMPDSLKHETEWAFFQAGLDAADIVVLGRLSHEVTPNPKHRRRLILTRSVVQCVCADGHVYWNPTDAPLQTALSLFPSPARKLAVVGGQFVFDFFLRHAPGYSRFHLSQIEGVKVPAGRAVFSAVSSQRSAADVLRGAGYTTVHQQKLASNVKVTSWAPSL